MDDPLALWERWSAQAHAEAHVAAQREAPQIWQAGGDVYHGVGSALAKRTHLPSFLDPWLRCMHPETAGSLRTFVLETTVADDEDPSVSAYYVKRNIFVCQTLSSSTVMIFAMYAMTLKQNSAPPRYVLEYPKGCGNKRNDGCAYISYLDSSGYYKKPNSKETHNPYQSIVGGYLQFISALGYTAAHIWSCAPEEGHYIFDNPDKPIMTQKELNGWYEQMKVLELIRLGM